MNRFILNMIKEKYFCGLDLGTQKMKMCMIQIDDPNKMELLGVYENKTHGYINGAVSDLGEFTESIHSTLKALSAKTGVKIKTIHLGLGGDLINIRESSTTIPLIDKGSKAIVRRDIKKVNNQARLLGIKVEEEILHDLPQVYEVDEMNSALNPLGLYGRKLGVASLMIVANSTRIRNIVKAVNQAGLEVEGVWYSSYVSSGVVLSEREKEEGCILVDIGSHMTNLLFFKDRVLKYVEKIELGGEEFTKSIAGRLSLPLDLAEEIKKSYANCMLDDNQGDEEILVKRESTFIPIKRNEIFEAIMPDVNELVESIKCGIVRFELKSDLHQGFVFVGGGSLLPGLIEKVGKDTHLPVKLGKMKIVTKKYLNHVALYSSVVGLAKEGVKQSFTHSNGHSNWATNISSHIADLYHEYF